MNVMEIYNRLKFYADNVLGINETTLLHELPHHILTKIHKEMQFNKEDLIYFKDTFNVNVAFLLSGKKPLIRTDFKEINNRLLSKTQINELIFLPKERLN